MELKTNNGYFFQIDDEDIDKISPYTWYAHVEPYKLVDGQVIKQSIYVLSDVWNGGKNRQRLKLHRLIMNAPSGVQIDHIDGNGLNNCKDNLRFCSYSQNAANSKKRIDNTSGFRGVTWSKQRAMWQAQIRINGKHKVLGYFRTKEEAAVAYDTMAITHFGEFAKPNLLSMPIVPKE